MPIIIHGASKQKEFKKPSGNSFLTFSSPSSFTLAVYDATKHWDGTLEYYKDGSWVVWDGSEITSEQFYDNYVLYMRGTGNTVITGDGNSARKWVLNGTDIKCIGNIENLLDYATVESGNHPTMGEYCYKFMFDWCQGLIQAPILPATTLTLGCYHDMFYGCTSLTQAPDLPATTLAYDCYSGMFERCTSLIKAPDLPATTLAGSCYALMFYLCSSLTKAPALPATTLANCCYQAMFGGCSSLIKAPALPATTLAKSCYDQMFINCSSLKLSSAKTGEYTIEYRIPMSGEGTTADSALDSMFSNTGGTFTDTPTINTTYYLSSDNMVVRETEIATLNGYVGSMIDDVTPEKIGAVPTSRTVNGKALSSNITLSASDVSARPNIWTPSASDVGALPLSGGTLTGNLTGKYLIGTWLQATEDNHLSTASEKIAVFDSSGWVYYRTIAELLADLGIPDATIIRATTSVYGTTKLSTSVTSTSQSLAATPYAVKTALDKAKEYTDTAIGDAIAASY